MNSTAQVCFKKTAFDFLRKTALSFDVFFVYFRPVSTKKNDSNVNVFELLCERHKNAQISMA